MFNVYLISTDTFKATKLIKKHATLTETVDLEIYEQKKYSPIDYYVAGFEVGSSEDLKHSKYVSME